MAAAAGLHKVLCRFCASEHAAAGKFVFILCFSLCRLASKQHYWKGAALSGSLALQLHCKPMPSAPSTCWARHVAFLYKLLRNTKRYQLCKFLRLWCLKHSALLTGHCRQLACKTPGTDNLGVLPRGRQAIEGLQNHRLQLWASRDARGASLIPCLRLCSTSLAPSRLCLRLS